MIKQLSVVLLLAVPAVQADWMDELSTFVDVKERKLDFIRAEAAVQKYLDDDIKAMQEYEEEANDSDGTVWGHLRGYLNVAKWGSSKTDSWHHERVLAYLKELPKNPKELDGFVSDLIHLHHRKQELVSLREEYEGAQSLKEKVLLKTYVAGKIAEIGTRKVLIKKRLYIS